MWKNIFQNQKAQVGIAALGSLVTGSALGYAIAWKRLSGKYEQIVKQEIEEVKNHYKILRKSEIDLVKAAAKYQGSVKEADKYEGLVEELHYTQPHPDLEPIVDDGSPESQRLIGEGKALAEKIVAAQEDLKHEDESQSIFGEHAEDAPDDFDYEKELAERKLNPLIPYVITHDEYYHGERDFEQVSLTYYDGDGILSDDRDQVVDDVDKVVGLRNILKFGYGSNDRNVVYIRNENLAIDIEVLRSDGKYSREVLGFIEHSHKPRPRKFRDSDE